MSSQDPFDRAKEVLTDTFSQARAYTNVIMVAGYAGMFALWSALQSHLSPATNLAVGILAAISISAFVGWEIFGMVARFDAMKSMRMSLDNPERSAAEMQRYRGRAVLLIRKLERYWHSVMWLAVSTVVLAMAALLSAMCHALWLMHGSHVFSGESSMELNFLSVVLGGVIAGVVGFASFRLESWRNGRVGRKALATTLADDLATSAELYSEIIEKYERDGEIYFDLLEQVAFIRDSFSGDRSYFHLLKDADIRNRITTYFRRSYVALRKLRPKQEEIYRNKEGDEAAAKLKAQLDDLVEDLKEYRRHAQEISDQLRIRFD